MGKFKFNLSSTHFTPLSQPIVGQVDFNHSGAVFLQ